MNRLTRLQFVLAFGIIVQYSTGVLAQENTFQLVEFGEERFLTKAPVITGFEGSLAIIEFETMISTPAACAYYGIILPEEEIRFPVYRKKAVESLPDNEFNITKHNIKMDISKLESFYYDTELIKNGGGLIFFRIEVFDPRLSASRIFNGHFRYRREGEPKTGTYLKQITMTKGPFVDCVTHQTAVISWETDTGNRGAILIDSDEFTDDMVSNRHEILIKGLKPDSRYNYRIKYSADNGVTQEYSFRTAPEPGSRTTFKFGFMSDSRGELGGGELSHNGVNEKYLSEFLTALYYQDASFICFAGDLVNGYTSDRESFVSQLETWNRIVQPVASYLPIYEGMGNHEQVGNYHKVPDPMQEDTFFLLFSDREAAESAEACFASEFVNPQGSVYGFGVPSPESRIFGIEGAETGPSYVENVYSFNYGNAHFVALNTNYWFTGLKDAPGYSRESVDKEALSFALKNLGGNREGYVRSNQLNWLEQDLQAAQDDNNIDWVFIFLHEPAFPNGGHLRDAMYWGTSNKGELGGYNEADVPFGDVIDMRNRFLKIITQYNKVLAILSGHEHNYSRIHIDTEIYSECLSPVWQIISGGCGAPFYVQDKSAPWVNNVDFFATSKHYCLFTVNGESVSLTVVDNTGKTLDHVEYLATIK